MAQYMTLQEVLDSLQIDEGKLRELIAEGKLRSFRDPSGEKFMADQVEKVAPEVQGDPTIVLSGGGGQEEPPALQIDDPDDEPQTVIPTIELSFDDEQAASSETMIPTIELGPDDGIGADTSAPTEALAFEDEATDVATEEVALADDDYVILDEKPSGGRGLDFSDTETDTSDDTATDSIAGAALEFEEEPAKHTFSTVMLAIAGIALLFGIYLFYSGVTPPMNLGVKQFFLDLVKTG